MAEDRLRILVVDDDEDLLEMLQHALSCGGHEVLSANTGRMALRTFYRSEPDIVILDIMLPDLSGFEVCQRIREVSDTPILILSARSQEVDIARGLDLGADDYLTKPFSPAELLARVKALWRRSRAEILPRAPSYLHLDNRVGIDMAKRRVVINGKPACRLSPTETRLLEALAAQADETIPFDELCRRVWGSGPELAANLRGRLKTYVHYLRRKIEENPAKPRYIVTDRGLGYRLRRR